MALVRRFDRGHLAAPGRVDAGGVGGKRRSPQGGCRFDAYLTRTGVFEYEFADGRKVREWRPASEVFAPAAMDSLHFAPVTDLHPADMVSPENYRSLNVGLVEKAWAAADRVAGVVTVQDAAVLGAIDRGERSEISCGYWIELDETPGVTPEGEPYDAVQRSIFYNHIALGPVNWGRMGPDVKLLLDSTSAIQVAPMALPNDADRQHADDTGRLGADDEEESMKKKKIVVDGVEVELDESVALVIERSLDSYVKLKSDNEKLSGKCDTLTAQNVELTKQLADARAPAVLDTRVADRVELERTAAGVLGTADFKGKSDREVKVAVVAKRSPSVKLDGKSDDYVQAAYDTALAAPAAVAHEDAQVAQDAASDAVDEPTGKRSTAGNSLVDKAIKKVRDRAEVRRKRD